jgi:hypothetical protein
MTRTRILPAPTRDQIAPYLGDVFAETLHQSCWLFDRIVAVWSVSRLLSAPTRDQMALYLGVDVFAGTLHQICWSFDRIAAVRSVYRLLSAVAAPP